MAETNFDEWYKEHYLEDHGEFDNLSNEDKKKYQEEFEDFKRYLAKSDNKDYDAYKASPESEKEDATRRFDIVKNELAGKTDEKEEIINKYSCFETWLAHSEENKDGKKKLAELTDDKERQEILGKFDAAFKTWAKEEQHIDDLTVKTSQEIAKLYDDYAMHVGKMNINQNQNNPDPNTDWRQDKINSWKNWCEQEHTPAYFYDEDPNEKTALKFDVYKTPEDKQAGKKAATIHYNNPRDVTIGTNDEQKAPDLEFFDKLTKEAKKDKIPGVTFDGEMTPEFKNKLAIACLKNGLKMDGFDDKIDTNLLSDEEKKTLDPTLMMKIEYHNTQKDAAKYAQEHESDKKITMKDLMGEEKDPALAAIRYTAYKNAGIEVEGVKEFNADSEGLFKVPPKKLLPEEVQKTIGKHNKETTEAIYQECQDEISKVKNDPSKSITLGYHPQGTKPLPIRDALLYAAAKEAGLEIGNDPKKDTDKKVYIGAYKYQPLQINPYMQKDARDEIDTYNKNMRQKQLDNIKKRREELSKTGTDEQKAQIDERAKFEAARQAIKDGNGTDEDRATIKAYRSKIAAQNRALEEEARKADPNYKKVLTTANSLLRKIKDNQNS